MQWLHTFYGPQLGDLPQDAPIWVSLSTKQPRRPPPDLRQAAQRLFLQYHLRARLGESKVHMLRHTFTDAMEESGAKLSEIRDRLGHANSAITDRYLQRLRQAKNRQGSSLPRCLVL